jgi:type VI secretion system secreted protein Hcp
MDLKSFTIVSLAIAGVVLATTPADSALNAYMTVKGDKQGLIKGGVTQKGREGKIAIIAASHQIVSPRDAATGQATGKRMHKPFTVVMEWDRSMPAFYRAIASNETLTDVTIDFYTPSITAVGGGGQEFNYFTVKLTNASISSIEARMPNNKMLETSRLKEQLEVSFTYQKIEFNNKQGGGIATDDWSSIRLEAEPKSPLLAAVGL